MLAQILIAIVAFSGLPIGYLLTFLAKEEIKPGKKYFLALRRLLLVTLAITLLSQVWTVKTFLVPLIIGILIGYFFHTTFFYLGLALAASVIVSTEFFVLVASLIFLYGIPFGSSSYKIGFPLHAALFFIPLMLMLFFSPNNTSIMLPLVAGTLVLQK